jgi:hypothetical protein
LSQAPGMATAAGQVLLGDGAKRRPKRTRWRRPAPGRRSAGCCRCPG